ncbi:MAG TPA: DUF5131 family protein [Bacilli bacterium]|nr:DUF5131 family protein [Bacilli bacterium]
MAMWNPFRGCKRCSEGCKYCYIHKGDIKRNINTSDIVKTKDFTKIIDKNKKGEYKVKSGLVYLCFSSDFLIEEADMWRKECFDMMRERKDLKFLFLTKRIDRFKDIMPSYWEEINDNVIVCCTIENQKNADYRLNIFKDLNIKHKCIIAQPLLENIEIEKYLDDIELVVVGGESDYNARVLNYDWVLNIRKQCINKNVDFEFRQCGTHFIKDNKEYYLKTFDLCRLAKKANINYKKC